MLKTPSNLPAGKPFISSVLAKIREIIAYLPRARMIAGNGITLRETATGVIVSASVSKPAKNAAQGGLNSMFTVSLDDSQIKITDPEDSTGTIAGIASANGVLVSCPVGLLQVSAGYLSLYITRVGNTLEAWYRITASLPTAADFPESSGFYPLAKITFDNDKWNVRQLVYGIVPPVLITGKCEDPEE